jgi:hypothetical protein
LLACFCVKKKMKMPQNPSSSRLLIKWGKGKSAVKQNDTKGTTRRNFDSVVPQFDLISFNLSTSLCIGYTKKASRSENCMQKTISSSWTQGDKSETTFLLKTKLQGHPHFCLALAIYLLCAPSITWITSRTKESWIRRNIIRHIVIKVFTPT